LGGVTTIGSFLLEQCVQGKKGWCNQGNFANAKKSFKCSHTAQGAKVNTSIVAVAGIFWERHFVYTSIVAVAGIFGSGILSIHLLFLLLAFLGAAFCLYIYCCLLLLLAFLGAAFCLYIYCCLLLLLAFLGAAFCLYIYCCCYWHFCQRHFVFMNLALK
jgi:hypothetical protein